MKKFKKSTISDFIFGMFLTLLALFAFFLSWEPRQKSNLLPMPKLIHVISGVSSAFDYAHANGIVHRDIKPANIMILNSVEIKVTDFGIARVMTSSKTQTRTDLGTPSYMSPEQIAGKKVDGRFDIFSLGVVFYELLTGEKPFSGDSFATLMYNITSSAPPPIKGLFPNIPDKLVPVVEKLLAKDAEARYQTGKELMAALIASLN